MIQKLQIPIVTLLEFNASPDFVQSGERLKPLLSDMFKGIVNISIAPFFKLEIRSASNDSIDKDGKAKENEIGKGNHMVDDTIEKSSWILIGKGQVRGPT